MHTIRKKIEAGFEAFGLWVYRNRFKTLLFMLLVIAAFFSQLPKITIDTSSEGFLHEEDPILQAYNDYRDQFGRDEMVVLAIKPEKVFDQAFLKKLKAFHDELEAKVPYLDDINSLINARNTRGEGDRLIVEDLLENWPQNEAELRVREQLAMGSRLYRNFLLSEDGKFTAVMIRTSAFSGGEASEDVLAGFEEEADTVGTEGEQERSYLTDAENSEVVTAITDIVARYNGDDFPILAAGSPVVVDRLKRAMQHDMQTFTKFALLVIALTLALLFRRISGVLMPLVVVVLSLLSTFAVMAASGTAIKLPTQILPSFILAVGVAASVHLLAIFFRHYDKHGSKDKAVGFAMGHSGLAIFMTGLTTAAGLFSFAASEVAPIADLGRFAGAGVMISLLYTLILLPALIALVPIRRKQVPAVEQHGFMDRVLAAVAAFSARHSKGIVISSGLLLLIGIGGLVQISFYHNPLTWLPEHWEVRQANDMIDRELRGSGVTELVIDTGEVNGLYEPQVMARLETLHGNVERIQMEGVFVGKTTSVMDILKESNRALNENREEFYRLPQTRELIAQELLLFENSGSDDLEDFVDSQFSKARFSAKTPWVDAASHANLIREMERQAEAAFGDTVEYYVTGMGSLFSRTMSAAIESTKQSYVIAAIVIAVMMMALLGSVGLGLVSMIPNLLPIILAMCVMGYLDMPLDMFTMLIGSIAIGLVVDDTIHFMHNFRRYYQDSGNVELAVRKTLLSTGRAIMVTTIVLSSGFYIFMAATMGNVFNFGLITGTTIVLALLADLVLAPALMHLIYDRRSRQVGNA